jgi:hypothetical protein
MSGVTDATHVGCAHATAGRAHDRAAAAKMPGAHVAAAHVAGAAGAADAHVPAAATAHVLGVSQSRRTR